MVEKIKNKIKSMDLENLTPKELYYLVLTIKETQVVEFMEEHLENIHTIILCGGEE